MTLNAHTVTAISNRIDDLGLRVKKFAALERANLKLRNENDELKERVRQLEESLIERKELPAQLGLTISERRLLGFLLKREAAYSEAIRTALFSLKMDEPASANLISVMICKMRKKLAPFGITIETIWGQGYYLPEQSKAKLRAM